MQTATSSDNRDHGGDLERAIATYGGSQGDWLDLSTGINPVPFPVSMPSATSWTALPDRDAQEALLTAARSFWQVPEGAAILATPGASAVIAQIPRLAPPDRVYIPAPTYNEHAAAFRMAGWHVSDTPDKDPSAQVLVHPNNPDGRVWDTGDLSSGLNIIDESFCDIMPAASMIEATAQPNRIVLKSFGKFWGLAGLRLGFAIGDPIQIARLAEMLGPWPVSGPALEIGALALHDTNWAAETRARLATDAAKLDVMMQDKGAAPLGGTDLFRLYRVADAPVWQDRFAHAKIWTRIFPYAPDWIRLGLPAPGDWHRVAAA